ncbi:MAG: ribonuclease P protein component [Veillonella sp.]|nr:ribonuclease P protein component [Veillonella sp.]MCF0156041.1 ribonuclease P protein component [Veillonella sp.]
MNYGIDKARRIQKNSDYRLVYKHGKYEVGRLCVVYRMPVAKQKTRIGFVTGKKVGCAVERNRARRLMKEVYRLHQHEIREGYSIVIVGRAGLSKADYQRAEKELMYLFRKSKLLKD